MRRCGPWAAGLALVVPLLLLGGGERGAGVASGAQPATSRFTPVADASVSAAHPRSRHGRSGWLTVDGAPVARAFVRFDVRASGEIQRATLRLYALSRSKTGYRVRAAGRRTWRESTLTYAGAPRLSRRRVVGSSGAFRSRRWTSVDVTALVRRLGLVTLALTTRSKRAVRLASRESPWKPALVVETTAAEGVAGPLPVATDVAIGGAPETSGKVVPPEPTAIPAATPEPPAYRYLYNSDSDPSAAASHGWNLLDAGFRSAVDALPAGTRALVWAGDYDNSTCDWEVSDEELTSEVEPMAGDPKVAGYLFSDEPDPDACPAAPAQHAARSRLLHALDPGRMTVMVMDTNSGQASLDQMPLWVGAADYVGLDPYPCYQDRPCDYGWIDAVIQAADRAGLPYWGVVQAFADSTWRWPTPQEERHMLSQWTASRQSGYMTFAWQWAGNALSTQPELLAVLRRFNGLN